MFDFLKKPTHHHSFSQKNQARQEIQPHTPPPKYKETIEFKVIPKFLNHNIEKNKQKKVSRVKKYQESSEVHLTKQVQDKLKDLLLEAKDTVSNLKANEIIENDMKERERTAFIRYTSENQHQYLDQLYQKTNTGDDNLKLGLDKIIFGTITHISNDIEDNMYDSEIFKRKILSKEQIKEVEQLSHINLIKLKQGQIFSKVGELKMELHFVQEPQVISKAKQIVQKQTFAKDSQKIKQIQNFIANKKSQREQIERKKKEELEKQKIKQLQQKIAKQISIQKANSERHSRLVQKFQAKQILKQKKQQEAESEKKKFAHFLKQYKNAKPLYQKKMQEQIQIEIEDRKQRYKKMFQRKGKYNPISFADIEDFQQKYLELKRQQSQKKKIERMIKKDEQKYRIEQMRDKHYKGKYRYLVLQQMVNKEAKNKQEQYVKRILQQKKRAYSVDIKEKYKPKIDENKRMEIQKFVSKTERKRKHKGPRRVRLNSSDPYDLDTINYEDQDQHEEIKDPKKEGDKNMRLFKQYIHEKIKRGEIKRPETFQAQSSTIVPRIDYLKEQRENREIQTSFIHQSLDASSRIKKIKSQAKGDLRVFKLKAEELDQKARRQELKLKYSEHTPNDEKQLEQNYLASIQAKLEILNSIK